MDKKLDGILTRSFIYREESNRSNLLNRRKGGWNVEQVFAVDEKKKVWT